MKKAMDNKSDLRPQWQHLRSTICLKGNKYNNHKKCPNRGRNCSKGKDANQSTAKTKPTFEYNLEHFPQLGVTNLYLAHEKSNNRNKTGISHGSINIEKKSYTSAPEIISDEDDYVVQVLSEANEKESEKDRKCNKSVSKHSPTQFFDQSNNQKENREICLNTSLLSSEPDAVLSQSRKRVKKKITKNISKNTNKIIKDNNNNNRENKIEDKIKEKNGNANEEIWTINTEPIIATVLRNDALHESNNTLRSPEIIQDGADFVVYKSKGHRTRRSSVSSDCARQSASHKARQSSVSSDRARHSSTSSDTSFTRRLSIAEVPDNWESRDSTASPGDLQPKDIKLPSRTNNNSLIADYKSKDYQNVSPDTISTSNLYGSYDGSLDIELPYKPKPVKLTDQELENLKIIRPKTYKLYELTTSEYDGSKSLKTDIAKNTASNNSKKIMRQDGLENNKSKSRSKRDNNLISKSSANNTINKNVRDFSLPVHFDGKRSSFDYHSNSANIRRVDVKNNELTKNESIGNDFLTHSSFLINHEGRTKNLEDNSKNPSRRNSSEFGQRYHTWAPETFYRPSAECPKIIHSPDWRRKSFSPRRKSLDEEKEEDYYFGNIPYDLEYLNGSDYESTPRSLFSPLDDYTSSQSSSEATSPPSLADMLNLHSSTPCSWDPNKSNSPIANHMPNGDLGFVNYTGVNAPWSEYPAVRSPDLPPPLYSAMPSPMLDMFNQYQIPGSTKLTSHLLPPVTSSSDFLDSSLLLKKLVTKKRLNLYEESLLRSKNCPKQVNGKISWFDPIMGNKNIWA